MTTLEDISTLTQPHHPDDWSERRFGRGRHRPGAGRRRGPEGRKRPSRHGDEPCAAWPTRCFSGRCAHDPSDVALAGPRPVRAVLRAQQPDLYLQLYLGGFGLELSDIESLRTWGSKTPGHPEFRHTNGVEITTGPLGQGLASAVGMAMAARYERGLFDPDAAPGTSPFDHFIYVIASDGDIEEGVTSEASSLAGVQQLGNLIVFYDHNEISIEDDTNIALCEDTAARYEAYGWHVQHVEGGENVVGIEEAIAKAKAVTDKPSFISVRTIIGYPAPKLMNTGKAHGSALGDEEVAAVKKILGFDPDKKFEVRDEVIAHTRELVQRGKEAHDKWNVDFDAWAEREPERKKLLDRLTAEELPDGWDADIPHWEAGRQATGHPRGVRQGAERGGPEAARVVGRLGRPGRQQQHHHRRVRFFRSAVDFDEGLHRGLVRPHPALRHSRTRDGRDPVRHRAARPDPRLRRHVPAVLRLHAPGGAAGLADGHRHHLRLDARLDRARRRRPDPSADRAPGRAAGHPQPVGGAPGRRQRDGLRLAHRPGPRQRQRSGRADPDPPGYADTRGHQLRGRGQGRLHPRRRRAATSPTWC